MCGLSIFDSQAILSRARIPPIRTDLLLFPKLINRLSEAISKLRLALASVG
jgi:hypothetical protein